MKYQSICTKLLEDFPTNKTTFRNRFCKYALVLSDFFYASFEEFDIPFLRVIQVWAEDTICNCRRRIRSSLADTELLLLIDADR